MDGFMLQCTIECQHQFGSLAVVYEKGNELKCKLSSKTTAIEHCASKLGPSSETAALQGP
jgi:hypothetical protein